MGFLPVESVIIFDTAALLSGLGVLVIGYRLNRIIPLHLLYLGLPVYVVGGLVTWYGAIALVEDAYRTSVLHIDLQPLVMAIIGILLANILWSLLSYARQATGEKG